MHRNLFAAALLSTFVTILSAQEDVSQAKWSRQTVVIDGHNNEWSKPFNLYAGSTGLMFSIANDSSALYLCFTGNDEMKMRKMMRAGWKLELSSKEKNKKFSATIIFPIRQIGNFENKAVVKFDGRNHHDWASSVNSYKMQFTNITASGFRTKNGVLPAFDANGIQVSIGDDSIQGVIYEIAIPLKELFDVSAMQLREQLLLNVTVNAMESPTANTGFHGGEHQGRSGGDWGGRGGMGGGGMGGGTNPMGSNTPSIGDDEEPRNTNMQSRGVMFESASFKQKFRLANQ